MANMTIHTPGLQNLFQALTGGGANVNDLIQADLNRARRDQIGAGTAKTQAELAAINAQSASMARLQELLADPALGGTPEGRASIMSAIAGSKDGLKHGPGFAFGSTVFTNPDTFTRPEMSNVGFATGVQPDWSKTPDGQLAELLSGVEEARIDATGGGKRAPLTVNGGVLKTLDQEITTKLSSAYPDAAASPEVVSVIRDTAAKHYQQSRNVLDAVDKAMAEIELKLQGENRWFGDPRGLFGGQQVVLGASGAEPAPMPSPDASPASAIVGEQTAVNPTTGERIVFRNNQWVPL